MAENNNPGTPPENDNTVIRQMRDHIKELESALKTTSEKEKTLSEALAERDKEKLTEIERLQADLNDAKATLTELSKKAEEHDRLAQSMEAIYKDELSKVPEDIRATVEALSSVGNYGDRLKALRAATTLAGVKPPSQGQVTQPPSTTPPVVGGDKSTQGEVKYDPKNLPSYGSIFRKA